MENFKPRIHFAPQYFQNPVHRISVDLVGAGGNGSQMLSALARIDHALRSLGKQGLHVKVWDPDTVEESNIGRQLFSYSEIGLNKAEALVTRFNRFFGLDWEAKSDHFRIAGYQSKPNVIITCVDNVKTRKGLGRYLKGLIKDTEKGTLNEYSWVYWMDLGNSARTGQMVLGSTYVEQPKMKKYDCMTMLPLPTEELRFSSKADRNNEPSCSMATALKKQDLFINSTLVQMSGSLLWNLLKDGYIQHRGFYLNLDAMQTLPIEI